MKKLNLTEATILALEGKLPENNLRAIDYSLVEEVKNICDKYKVPGTKYKIEDSGLWNRNYAYYTINPFTTDRFISHGETNDETLYNKVVNSGIALMEELANHFKLNLNKSNEIQGTTDSITDGSVIGNRKIDVDGVYDIEYRENTPIRAHFDFTKDYNKKYSGEKSKYGWTCSVEIFKLPVKYKTYSK